MTIDESRTTDIAEQAIVRQARMLDKQIEPEQDLWPGIARRIDNLPQQQMRTTKQNSWMPVAVAASLIIAVFSLGFAGFSHFSVIQSVQPAKMADTTINMMEQHFMLAKTNYLTALVTREQSLSPEVREVLQKNLKIIDDANRAIKQALKENPNDAFLTEALVLTHRKELHLLNRLTNHGLNTI